jgi:hypothetical protein
MTTGSLQTSAVRKDTCVQIAPAALYFLIDTPGVDLNTLEKLMFFGATIRGIAPAALYFLIDTPGVDLNTLEKLMFFGATIRGAVTSVPVPGNLWFPRESHPHVLRIFNQAPDILLPLL